MKTTPLFLALAVCASTAFSFEPTSNQPISTVLGQPNFSRVDETPVSASSVSVPEGVVVDPATGKLFVADSGNNRILRFSSVAKFQMGAAAEEVIGQPDFVSNDVNRGNVDPDATTLEYPINLAIDSAGRLWVTDWGNRRVLRYDDAATETGNIAADQVIGQANFTATVAPGPSGEHSGFNAPTGIAIDSSGNLYVADGTLDRVLRFDDAANQGNGPTADLVIGQPDLATFNQNNSASATRFFTPYGIGVDGSDHLWVTDPIHHRVLRFDNASTLTNPMMAMEGPAADAVYGQDDFTSSDSAAGADGLNAPYYAAVDTDGVLWISDYSNNRVLGFRNGAMVGADGNTVVASPLADIVLGQPDFDTVAEMPNNNRSLSFPTQVTFSDEALFVAQYDEGMSGNRIARYSVPVRILTKNRVATRRPVAVLRGKSTGAENVAYKAPKKGFRDARGVSPWRAKVRKLSRRVTRVSVRATAFDNLTATTKVKVILKKRR